MRATRRRPTTARTVAPEPREAATGARSRSNVVVDLQRDAGNRAVSGLLAPTVQRHKGTEPEIAAAHVVSSDEQKDLPAAADLPGLNSEQTTLLGERKPVADRIKAAKAAKSPEDPADKAQLKKIDDRLVEIKKKFDLRVKGDEAVTLERNGYTAGAAAWFADVHTVTFLDRPVTVHALLAARLKTAEDALAALPKPAGGWTVEGFSTLRPPGASLHSFGLAIDVNPGTNPFLVQPTGAAVYEPTAWSRSVRDVIERAALLVLGRTPDEEAFFTRPDVKDKDARVAASYDKVSEASGALKRYFTLVEAGRVDELAGLVTALGEKDPKHRTAADWVKTIKADRAVLGTLATNKKWQNPEQGFLNMDKRLVTALTDSKGAGLTWLGDDTVSPGRDIMHFDLRGVGPITKIWSSGLGRDTYLGAG